MMSIRSARLCSAIAVAAYLLVQPVPSAAEAVAYVSATGGGSACTAGAPCGDFVSAILALLPGGGGRILCIDPASGAGNITTGSSNLTLDIDCPGGSWGPLSSFNLFTYNNPAHITLTFRNMNFTGLGSTPSAIKVLGSGTLIFDHCALANFGGSALDIEPDGAFNLVITNSRISSSASGILLKPQAGGSIALTLDHVAITQNTGGGIKIDTTNGPVTVDITDSVVSNNSANGINAVGNAGGQAMLSVKNSVIAKNGLVGVQANGANAGVLVQTTLLDQNVAGATSVVNGGHISTYGNNSIVGSAGSGFTGSAPLQ